MTREQLPKSYEPSQTERRWRAFWIENKFSEADRTSNRPAFSIVIPPPNVTGRLHMGHALVQTVQDILARFKRMKGFEVMWVPGTDHAGISTQTVVERHLLSQKGIRRAQMTREQFLEYCWQWKRDYEASILDQIKLLGCSCDWSMLAFTMDEPRSKAVRTAFKKLYEKGLIYRGDYLVNWDPVTQTALADDEVEHEERAGWLWHISYPLPDGKSITVATTRPETLLGDVAVAVHPEDSRYKDFIGQIAQLPLLNRPIPILADSFVDPAFGTGAVKITPAHDPNDYQMGLRHHLPMINILNPDGILNEHAGPYKGLSIAQAREQIVNDLKAKGLLVNQIPHTHRVGLSYRSKAVIEPMLSKQWFVKLSAFKQLLRQTVESGQVELIPCAWQSTYFHWIDNLRDWCISRQLWWGHRIPIWYRKDDPDQILCYDGADIPQLVQEQPHLWKQEEDVLDTWFSSALWPLSTMGWPDRTLELSKFYPTSILVTGHDILFFWVARMMLMCELMGGQMPFSKVYLHGLIFAKSYWRDQKEGGIAYVSREEREAFELGKAPPKGVHSKWEKMSKSKGNVIDPLEMIEKYGTDALRMALATSLGDARQIDLDRRKFEEFKNFSNKVFNGARFVLMNLDQEPALQATDLEKGLSENELLSEDSWILQRCSQAIDRVSQSLENFEFATAATTAYDFFWDELCAYYLEISKPVLWSKSGTAQNRLNKQILLAILLSASLRLLHPFTPFITEELLDKLRERLGGAKIQKVQDLWTQDLIASLQAPCCMKAAFPLSHPIKRSQSAETIDWLCKLIYQLRVLRADMKIPTGAPTDLYFQAQDTDTKTLMQHEYVLKALVPIHAFYYNMSLPERSLAASLNFCSVTVTMPLPPDMAQAECERLKKQMEQLQHNMAVLRQRLDNQDFIQRAPAELVDKQTKQCHEMQAQYEQISARLASFH